MGSTRSESTSFSRLKTSHSVRGYIFIAAAALWWGISATLGRAVFTGKLAAGGAVHAAAFHPIDPLILAQSRTTISFLVLAPLLLARRGRGAVRMNLRDVLLCLALGVIGMAGSNYFYYLAIQRTSVATAIILQYTAPVWVLVYMLARHLQRPTARRIGSVVLAVVGIVLAIGLIGAGGFKLDTVGVIAAEIAALTFAFYNVTGSHLLERHDRWQVLLFCFFGAAVFWQIINPPWKIMAAHYSSAQWIFMVVFAVTSVLLPFSLYFGGMQYLDATRAIVTCCLEPVFSVVIAAVALGELVAPVQILGMIVVLAATVLVQLPERTPEPGVVVDPIE